MLYLLQKFFLVRRREILETQILRVMSDQIGRFISEVTCGGNERVGVFTEACGVVRVHAEFGAAPVVDEQDSQIVADVAVAQRIHIVKERQIADHAEMNSVAVGKRHSQCRRQRAVNSATTQIRAGHYGVRQLEERPRTHGVAYAQMNGATFGQARRSRLGNPDI